MNGRDKDAGRSQGVVPQILGRVECVMPETVVVSILNGATGETIEAECSPNAIAQAGLSEGDEFSCEVRLTKLEPKLVSEDRIAEILKEVAL